MALEDDCVEIPLTLLTVGAVAATLHLPSNTELASIVPTAVNYRACDRRLHDRTETVFEGLLGFCAASAKPLSWHCKITAVSPAAMLWVNVTDWLKVKAALKQDAVAAAALHMYVAHSTVERATRPAPASPTS
jgi:hypothetical protein